MTETQAITATAYGRIGLLGNPSDMYGGKCVSFTFDRRADVTLRPASSWEIEGHDLVTDTIEYDGRHDLVKACIRRLKIAEPVAVHYTTTVPIDSGLAGSSAIIIATMRALNEHFALEMTPYDIAEQALYTETEELNIAAGFQDRYAISFEGLQYLDFTGKEFMRADDPFGRVEEIPVRDLPFFLCINPKPRDLNSGVMHTPLRQRFLDGETWIKDDMDKIAALADAGRDAILARDWPRLGDLMNENTWRREALSPHLPDDLKLIHRALELGALGAKLAGSGGGIVILSEDPRVQEALSQDFDCFAPAITP